MQRQDKSRTPVTGIRLRRKKTQRTKEVPSPSQFRDPGGPTPFNAKAPGTVLWGSWPHPLSHPSFRESSSSHLWAPVWPMGFCRTNSLMGCKNTSSPFQSKPTAFLLSPNSQETCGPPVYITGVYGIRQKSPPQGLSRLLATVEMLRSLIYLGSLWVTHS